MIRAALEKTVQAIAFKVRYLRSPFSEKFQNLMVRQRRFVGATDQQSPKGLFAMKNFVLGLSLVFAATSANAAATSWASINRNLDVVAQDVKKDFPFLTDLNVKFDARVSDLAGDRVKVGLSASTDQAVWGDKKATAAIGLGVDARTLVGTQRKLQADLSGNLKTQTLPALKHLFRSFVNKCNANKNPAFSFSEIREAYVCDFLKEMDAASNISELKAAITSSYSAYANFLPTYIQLQKENLKVETDADAKNEIEYNIARAESDVKSLAQVKISGDAKKIVIDIAMDVSFGVDIALGFKMVFTENASRATLDATALLEDKDYQDYKTLVVDVLSRLETNEKEVMGFVTEMAKSYAQFIGEYITK